MKYIMIFTMAFIYSEISAKDYSTSFSSRYGFIENKGQILDQNFQANPKVLYLWNGGGINVQLKENGFSYEVINSISTSGKNEFKRRANLIDAKFENTKVATTNYIHRVDVQFIGSNPHALLTPTDKNDDYINYYTTGIPTEGIKNVFNYNKVKYIDIYPNIDVEYLITSGDKNKFKYNFIVRPGGNVNDIKLKYIGASKTMINHNGEIEINTTSGNINESIPISFEANSNKRIDVKYVEIAENTYGLHAGEYDSHSDLVIDPWATYYGDSGDDESYSVVTDNLNNVYITGYSGSANNIATAGAHQVIFAGGITGGVNFPSDVIVIKFNSAGIRQWGTYYGGSGIDIGYSIAVDPSNNILVTGRTGSGTSIATPGAHQPTYYGGLPFGEYDAFIAKFDATGVLQWGTYYGGGGSDYGYGITTDASGNIFATGCSGSSTNIATPGAYQNTIIDTGLGNAYIVKFNTNGIRQWGTYYGGSGYSAGYAICTDATGNILITGETGSINGIASVGSHQANFGGAIYDAFVAKFNTSCTRLWGTYYGGSGDDQGRGISTDASSNILITGMTNSISNISTVGAHQAVYGGGLDGYIVKFNSSGVRQWGSYYGGNNGDVGNAISADNTGNIYTIGFTNSTSNIATAGAHQPILGGGWDAFIVKFNTNGIRQWGTYYGGSGNNDRGIGIKADGIGNVLASGFTNSNCSIATVGSHQENFGGASYDAFVASFSSNGVLSGMISNNTISSNQGICINTLPALFTGSIPVGGMTCTTILWIQSTISPNTGFSNAVGINNMQDYQAPILNITTWYKRIVLSGNVADTSNAIEITVNPIPAPAIINTGGILSVTGGPYSSYQWFLNGTAISGEINATHTVVQNGIYTVEVHLNGCPGMSPGINLVGVGVENINNENYIFVSPNPTNNIIRISGIIPYKIQITNILGHSIMEEFKKSEISVQNLKNGLYFVKLYSEQGILLHSEKLVKY